MDGKRGFERLFRWTRPRAEPQAIDAAGVGTTHDAEFTIDAGQQAAAARWHHGEVQILHADVKM